MTYYELQYVMDPTDVIDTKSVGMGRWMWRYMAKFMGFISESGQLTQLQSWASMGGSETTRMAWWRLCSQAIPTLWTTCWRSAKWGQAGRAFRVWMRLRVRNPKWEASSKWMTAHGQTTPKHTSWADVLNSLNNFLKNDSQSCPIFIPQIGIDICFVVDADVLDLEIFKVGTSLFFRLPSSSKAWKVD